MEFEQIYNLYFERIYRYLRARVASAHDAEDITSQVFTAAWEVKESFQTEAYARNWLFRVAYNKLVDFIRTKYRFEFTDLEEFAEVLFEQENTDESKPHKTKFTNICWQLVDQLTEAERKLIQLKYQEELTFAQLANTLNITANNAKVKHNRIIKKLINLWNKTNQNI